MSLEWLRQYCFVKKKINNIIVIRLNMEIIGYFQDISRVTNNLNFIMIKEIDNEC